MTSATEDIVHSGSDNTGDTIIMSSSRELTSSLAITEEISKYDFNDSSTLLDEFVGISTENSTNFTQTASLEPPYLPPERKLSVAYTVSEATVSLLAIFGNALVAYIFCKNRSLRRYRNYYIFALAIADFLVGLLGIPFAVLASVGLPRNLYGCLFTVSILMVLCTVSILCLVAVSIDRYWATTNPFAYYRNMTTTTAVSIILFCWVAGAIIGFLPLFGWYNREGWERDPPEYCFFTDVMDYSYLVFLYFATIVFPALLMIGFYGYIYHVVLIKIRQKGTLAPQQLRRFSEQSRTGSINCENRSATQVLRIMVSEKRREAKAAKKLGIIVLFFMLCWMPLYTINCIQAFYPKFHVPIELLNFTIILSHANSALNPFLYAYHLKEFRLAMKNALLALCGKIFCGLVNAHVDKENPLGPMSRSLTMPSLGHVTTIPNPATGKVSIKFRKIGRTDDCRSVAQISPTQHKNLNSMMMVNNTPSKDNLLHTSGGTDKSLTSLSLASDSSNQLVGIPLQQLSSLSTSMKNSPKINGNKNHKYSDPNLYEKVSMSPPAQTPELIVTKAKEEVPVKHFRKKSYSSLPDEVDEDCMPTASEYASSTTMGNVDDEKVVVGDESNVGCGDSGADSEGEGTISCDKNEMEEMEPCGKLLSSATQIAIDEPLMNSHPVFNNECPSVDSSHNESESNVLKKKFLMSQTIQPMSLLQQQQHNNFEVKQGSHRVSLDG